MDEKPDFLEVYEYSRLLPDGKWAAVYTQLTGTARLVYNLSWAGYSQAW